MIEHRRDASGNCSVITHECGLCGAELDEQQGMKDHLPRCPAREVYAEIGALRQSRRQIAERVQEVLEADQDTEDAPTDAEDAPTDAEPALIADGGLEAPADENPVSDHLYAALEAEDQDAREYHVRQAAQLFHEKLEGPDHA